MDPTTEEILEKTRQRRLQLDKELSKSAHSSMTDTETSTLTMTLSSNENDGAMNLKKRKAMDGQDQNDHEFAFSGTENMPTKKTSAIDDFSQLQATGPTKPPRSFYPLEELEAMAKEAQEPIPAVTSSPPKSSLSVISKASDTCRSSWAGLAANLDNFEFQAPRSHSKQVTFSKNRQEHSPSRWGTVAPAMGSRSPVLIQVRQATPSKGNDYSNGDSGIESFYRHKPNEERNARSPRTTVDAPINGHTDQWETVDSKIPTPPPPPPPPSTTSIPSFKSTIVSNAEPTASSKSYQPKKLGGLASLLVADQGASTPANVGFNKTSTASAGKVASLTGQWENQIQIATTEKSPMPKRSTKLAATSVDRERNGAGALSPGNLRHVTTKSTSVTPKKTITAGVDTRPRPEVSNLRNRWEKASQLGVTLNPDDSMSESDALTSSAMRMFQVRPLVQQQQPVEVKFRRVQSPVKFDNPTSKEYPSVIPKFDNPSLQEYPSVIPKPPKSPEKQATPPKKIQDSPKIFSPEKSPKGDFESQNSSALSDYLDDVISCAQAAAATPPKPSSVNIISASSAPLMYTVSFYRNTTRKIEKGDDSQAASRPESIIVKAPTSPQKKIHSREAKMSSADYEKKAQELSRKIAEKQTHISQLSRALNVCKESSKFRASAEEVEAHKNLLIATEHRRCLVDEKLHLDDCQRNRLPYHPAPPLGTLTINNIKLPLQRSFLSHYAENPDDIYYFMCVFKYRDTFYVTEMIDSDDDLRSGLGELTFSNYFQFHNLPPNFEIAVEVFVLQTVREQFSHNEKFGTSNSSKLGTLGKQRTLLGLFSTTPSASSLGGPSAVMNTSFQLAGQLKIMLPSVGRRRFALQTAQVSYPLEGSIQLELRCVSDQIGTETERGFLDCYEEIGGIAAWNRLWCVFNGNTLSFWKYPEDEVENKRPISVVDLRNCISEFVGLAPEEITSRPNSFAFDCSNDYSYIFATDSKQSLSTWCGKLNEFLNNYRMWSVDGQ